MGSWTACNNFFLNKSLVPWFRLLQYLGILHKTDGKQIKTWDKWHKICSRNSRHPEDIPNSFYVEGNPQLKIPACCVQLIP